MGLAEDGQDVPCRQNQQVLAVQLYLGAAVLRVHDPVALLDVHGQKLAGVAALARAHGEDGSLLRLLLGRVGDHQAGHGGLLPLLGADEDAVLERPDGGLCSCRHSYLLRLGRVSTPHVRVLKTSAALGKWSNRRAATPDLRLGSGGGGGPGGMNPPGGRSRSTEGCSSLRRGCVTPPG